MNTRSPRRFAALVAPVAALALVLSACSSTFEDAATIRYEIDDAETVVHIDRNDLERDLRDIQSDPAIAQALDASSDPASNSASRVNSTLTAAWLDYLVYSEAVSAEIQQRGLEVDDAARDAAREQLGGFDIPDRLRDDLVERIARETVLQDDVMGAAATAPTEADARQIYDDNPEAFTQCESGKEVAHILVATSDEADALKAQLDAGGSFAELAQQSSTDTGSAAQGGSLGCLGAQPFVEEFQQAADAAALDTVVGPVESQFGFHLILVTGWDPQFEDYRDQILAQLQQQAQQEAAAAYGEVINGWAEAMDVDIDGRYGSYGFVEAEGRWRVTPPPGPEVRDQREPDEAPVDTGVLPEGVGG